MAEYIEKEAAISAIRQDIMGGLNYEGILNRIPSADVQPVRHGRWKAIDGEWYDWQCSECGSKRDGRTPYCPNCGCHMDLEVANER